MLLIKHTTSTSANARHSSLGSGGCGRESGAAWRWRWRDCAARGWARDRLLREEGAAAAQESVQARARRGFLVFLGLDFWGIGEGSRRRGSSGGWRRRLGRYDELGGAREDLLQNGGGGFGEVWEGFGWRAQLQRGRRHLRASREHAAVDTFGVPSYHGSASSPHHDMGVHPHVLGAKAMAAAMVGVAGQILGLSPLPDLLPKNNSKKKKKVRVYMDGCFDMMHYGHANALRQARALGDELVVGVISDEEIKANKGPPVMSMDERVVMVKSVKWVDEVIEDAPYEINEEFMNKLFTEHRIDYIIHGDDPCLLPDGSDAYAHAKKAGRYKQIKRTEGVSSTDIVGQTGDGRTALNDKLGY